MVERGLSLARRLRVYLVSPDGWGSRDGDEARLWRLLRAGVGAVQFRDKSSVVDREGRASRMAALCREAGALFIVNDHPELARDLGADGVHVGVSDASVARARALLGDAAIVGATASTLDRALLAVGEGADYLGVGAIFDATASKPDAKTRGLEVVRELRSSPELRGTPLVAIGGITGDRAASCYAAGADGVAMIRGLWSCEDPESLVRALLASRRDV